jgi:tight adherence protein C
MRPKFLRAGFRKENAQAVFWGAKCLFAALLPLGFLFVPLSSEKLLSTSVTVSIFIFLSFAGFTLPDLWLKRKIKKRKQRLFKGFPDALDLLVVCVEAGMGLDAAINRVAEEIRLTNKTLSDELRLLSLELRAGKPRRDALSDLAMRTDLEDVKSLTTLLIQADKFGTNVANSLRVYSDSFRTKRFQRAEELAAKIPVKLLIPLIFCIFPALFIVILGPAGIRIYNAVQFLKDL